MRVAPAMAAVLVLSSAPMVVGSSHLHPTVAATPRAFSPNADGTQDLTTIRATAGGVGTLIEVRLLSGPTVQRSWPLAPSPVQIVWDGRDTTGGLLPDGTYTLEAEASDAVTSEVARSMVVVDTQPPRLEVRKVRARKGSPAGTLSFDLLIADLSPSANVQIRVSDHAGVVDTGGMQASSGPNRVRWRPRYPSGAALYPGNYRAQVSVTDEAGNAGASKDEPLRLERRVRAKVFRRVSGAGNKVAITIDDCHFGRPWKRMLDTLRAMDAHATFFCPGDRMMLFKGLVQRTVNEGHVLGSHGWDHASLAGRSVAATGNRLRRDRRAAWKLARVTTAPYFRPPYGSFDRATVRGAGATGHGRVIMWDVDSRDTSGATGSALVRNSVGRARGGSIILMHTLDRTASALPAIIDGLRDKGLRPVTLPELFRAAGYR